MEEKNKNYISLNTVKFNNGKYGRRLFIIMAGNVFDLTSFNHPAGDQVFDNNEKDKLKEFNMIGHSNYAKKELLKRYIGKLL